MTSIAAATDYRYPGGKGCAGTTQWILGKLRTHVYYAEPFVGKGAIYRSKPPAMHSFLVDSDLEVIEWWSGRSHPGTIVHRGDGIRWMEIAADWGDADLMIYLDPPYVLQSRVKRRIYRHEMSDADHLRLLAAARRSRSHIAISGYATDLYDDILGDWYRFDRQVITRGRTMATEVLWTNYDPEESPDLTVEYSALGGDFRERERVHRKINRWVSRFRSMGDREQVAMLRALIAARGG
jgi:hypothetical protein